MGGKNPEPLKTKDIKEKAIISRAGAVRTNFGSLTAAGFAQRLAYFTAKVRCERGRCTAHS